MYLCTMSLTNLVSAWLPGVVNGFRTISVRPKVAVGGVIQTALQCVAYDIAVQVFQNSASPPLPALIYHN
jgi:hypothetical protein